MIIRGSSLVTDFLVLIKRLADELATLGAPPSDYVLLVYCTCGLGLAYKELVTTLCNRDTVISFEVLFDEIIIHERFLLYNECRPTKPVLPTDLVAK